MGIGRFTLNEREMAMAGGEQMSRKWMTLFHCSRARTVLFGQPRLRTSKCELELERLVNFQPQ
jgi:hypothetical protein